MKTRSLRRTIIISLTILLSAFLYFTVLSPVAAESTLSGSLDYVNCEAGKFTVTIEVFSDDYNATATVITAVENLENGSNSVKQTDVTFPGGYSFTHAHNIDADKGDKIRAGIFVKVGGSTVLSKVRTRMCGSEDTPPYIPGVVPLDPAEAAPLLAIPLPNGTLPCGVFDVNGWGLKIIWLEDFPDCIEYIPRLGVGCLTADGQWTDEHVHRLRIRADFREMKFGSSQHGACGIFPANTRPTIYGD